MIGEFGFEIHQEKTNKLTTRVSAQALGDAKRRGIKTPPANKNIFKRSGPVSWVPHLLDSIHVLPMV